MEMRPFGRLLPVEEARRRLFRAARPVARIEAVALEAALGRVAARTVRAKGPVPAFPRATWDGYAVRSSATRRATARRPVRLKIVGEVFAEGRFDRPLGSGETVAIATGGEMPRGTDAVLIFEHAHADASAIRVERPVPAGERVAAPGEDFPRGAVLVARGESLGPAALGALASIGCTRVWVYARPVVTIVPNGNELVPPGGPAGPGQIFESNNYTLGAVVASAGGIARAVPPVPDHPEEIERAIRAALASSDLVLVTGGSSVGERDYLGAVFPRLGRLLFHGIAVRPGKPTLAAQSGSKLVVGMPGHPTSCLSNGFWLLLPVLRKLARLPGPGWTEGSIRLASPAVAPTRGLSTVVPLRIERGWGYPTFHDSSAITSLARVSAFALIPPGAARLRRGSRVPVHLLPPPLGVPVAG